MEIHPSADNPKRTARTRTLRFFRLMLLLLLALCLIPVLREAHASAAHQKQQNELRSLLGHTPSPSGKTAQKENADAALAKTSPSASPGGETLILDKFQALYRLNPDLVGWLAIKGTKINDPVMQAAEDDYYLHRSFYGEKSRYGCLYVRAKADVDTPGTNCIIYGHNMKDGSMFGELDKYKSEAFFREHPTFSFDTLYEERTYQVIAVFPAQADEKQDGFKYYQFYQADTKQEFLAFYEAIRKLSLYDTGATAEFGDTFLTLSTCDTRGKNSRFVVVAKKILQEQ